MALVDSQMVAGMRRTLTPSRVTFELSPYRPLSDPERSALAEAAARYGRFLDRPVTITGAEAPA
jgi:hypothetical protein